MSDDIHVNAEELAIQLDDAVPGVAPGVLAAVIVGVLCAIGLMFTLAVFMDRWRRLTHEGSGSGRTLSVRSTRITILDDMSPEPTSEPPAASASRDC